MDLHAESTQALIINVIMLDYSLQHCVTNGVPYIRSHAQSKTIADAGVCPSAFSRTITIALLSP